MKGTTFGHSKQRNTNGQYLGITKPGIIATESPNPIFSDLVNLPYIEKRLKAFVCIGHGIIVLPRGTTTEEIFYILGILLNSDNAFIPFPLIFSTPKISREYFEQIDQFIGETLGEAAQKRYEIVIKNPGKIARIMKNGVEKSVRSDVTTAIPIITTGY